MKPILKSMPFLLASVLLLSFISPAWGQIAVKGTDEVNKEAEQYWDKMSDHLDPVALDQFISKFPDSQAAAMAFALRYTMLAENPNIEDYNNFLKQYPNRFQSQIALQELFELYRDQNRANGYLDFLQRYPDSQQALVAKLRLQTLMFQFVSLTNNVNEYEAFIDTFPDAPQVLAISQLAFERECQEEKAQCEAMKSDHAACERWSNSLVTEWEDWVSKYSKTADSGTLVFMYRIDRRAKVIRTVYSAYNAAARIRQEERHREIIAKLDGIQATLIKNNAELIKTLREESKRICDELKAGFELLHRDNQAMQKMIERKFEAIEKGMQRLHEDLVIVHNDLLGIRADLKTINESINEGNKKLDRLDVHLRNIHTESVAVRKDMNTGFQVMGGKIDALTQEVKTGFETTHRLQQHQIAISTSILKQTQDMTAVLNNGFGTIIHNQAIQQVLSRDTINTMQQGFGDLRTGQERQIALAQCNLKIGNDIARYQMQSLNVLIASRQDNNKRLDVLAQTMNAGFERVNQSVWASSDRAMQDNRKMVARINRARGGGNTLFGEMLGSTVGWVPLLGPVLERGLSKVGDIVWDKGKELATSVLVESKNLLFAAASRFAGPSGLTRDIVDALAQCVTDDDLKSVTRTIAESLEINPEALAFAANSL